MIVSNLSAKFQKSINNVGCVPADIALQFITIYVGTIDHCPCPSPSSPHRPYVRPGEKNKIPATEKTSTTVKHENMNRAAEVSKKAELSGEVEVRKPSFF